MKIKRSILKQIIKEEIGADPELINAIELLTKKIDNLDVSIDYLAAAATGEDALALSFGQSRFGRAARSKKKRYGKEPDDVMYGAATNIAKKNRGK